MKKSTLFLMGMLVTALTFGLILTGCPTDDATAEDDGKTVTVTGLDAVYNGKQCTVGLISSNSDITDPQDIQEWTIAGAEGTITNRSTGPITLYIAPSMKTLWTGSGSFYVIIVIESDSFISNSTISFNSVSTTVPYSDSTFASLGY